MCVCLHGCVVQIEAHMPLPIVKPHILGTAKKR